MKYQIIIVALLLSGTISAISKAQAPPQQARGGVLADRFQQLDRNGDGKLTPDEFPRADTFKLMDKNHDGGVTLDEARAFYGGRRQQANQQE